LFASKQSLFNCGGIAIEPFAVPIMIYWIFLSVLLLNSATTAFLTTTTTRGPLLRRGAASSLARPYKLRSGGCVHKSTRTTTRYKRKTIIFSSSFYGDFEKFDEEDDDDDDDEEDDDDGSKYEVQLDQDAVADFRSRMGSLFGDESSSMSSLQETEEDEKPLSVDDLISYATKSKSSSSSSPAATTEWARAIDALTPGVILLANPAKFCPDLGTTSSTPSPRLLNKFGLTLPPPADLGPDRRADLLPVLVLLDRHPLRGSQAVLLNRRTGYLLGDLEQQPQEDDDDDNSQQQQQASLPPRLGAFMIQPLWFGGTSAGGTDDGISSSSGLDMLHLCPTVAGAKRLTEDGMYWGGDPVQAQDAMTDPSLDRIMTGFDFKFFVQSTRWLPLQLENEVRDGTWFVAQVSKEIIFKSRDRMGTRRAKPLWTDIMELMGGEYKRIRDQLYGEQQL
jgi:hypothetical protein